MRRLAVAVTVSAAVSLLWAGCTSPTEPDPFGEPPAGTHQSTLIAVVGTGTGGTSVTSRAGSGHFVATIRFRVRARPSTTYLVQRAAELGRPAGDDGVCQRADGLPPWSAADAPFGSTFVTFPRPNDGPLLVITTNGLGEAALDYEFESPPIPTGTRFDVKMRLVDDESAPTSELRSGCMTVVVN